MNRLIAKALQPLTRKLRMIATRGVVKLVDPALMLQELQIAAVGEELLDNVEHWEAYGYTSRPHPGAEALLLSLGGDRDHTVAVNVADRRFRLKNLAPGEVAIYTDEGDVIHFKRGNQIFISTAGTLVANATVSATITSPLVDIVASTKCTITSPNTELTGNLQVGGAVVSQGAVSSAVSLVDPNGSMQSVRDTYNGHTHVENGGSGPTDAPAQTM